VFQHDDPPAPLGRQAQQPAISDERAQYGGHAFVRDSDVSTLWPMIRSFQVAPINNESLLNYIGEHLLGLPRSFGTA